MSLKIYYVDDEPELLEIFIDTFSTSEIEIKTFLDANEFIEASKNQKPDLVFIDYQLKNTTGPELARKIDASIPKFLITGDIFMKQDSQFISCVSKPLDIEAIKSLIASRLKLKDAAA